MEGRWKFLGWGDGVLKTQILEAKYETKLEFPGEGGGGAKQKPLIGGVWIFYGTAQCVNTINCSSLGAYLKFWIFLFDATSHWNFFT